MRLGSIRQERTFALSDRTCVLQRGGGDRAALARFVAGVPRRASPTNVINWYLLIPSIKHATHKTSYFPGHLSIDTYSENWPLQEKTALPYYYFCPSPAYSNYSIHPRVGVIADGRITRKQPRQGGQNAELRPKGF